MGVMRGTRDKFTLNEPMSEGNRKRVSRSTRLAAVIFMFAMLAGGALHVRPASAAAGCCFRTTTPLNLRAEPSLSAKVLLIMPAQAVVRDGDDAQNGFRQVEYNGTAGWAFMDYLVSTNPDFAPPLVGEATT